MGNGQGKPAELSGETGLNHFRLLRVVGRGAFGKVRIVERKDTGLTFALKYIRKDEVIKSESVRNVIRERRMLEHLNHAFLCNLRYSFQDAEYMYLVVDLMSGGDLRFHISRKTLTEEAVRFWIAELGCALRYVHSQNIIHRDVKPDNVLLDAEGHIHLTDFNVASDIIPGKKMLSKSGTLAYLAPEVYAGKGYDIRADWWSLGVVFYECIYNKRPFDGSNETTLKQQVQFTPARFPATQPPVSYACLSAMRAALDTDPTTRLGSTWESFIHHEFFRPLNFEALEAKQIEPIFVPSSEKTNFDATYDLEELLLEEAPLEARARRQKPREQLKEDATEQQIREHETHKMIEKEFPPFDYTLAAYQMFTEAQGLPEEDLRKIIPESLLNAHPTYLASKPPSATGSPSKRSSPTSRQGPPSPLSAEPNNHYYHNHNHNHNYNNHHNHNQSNGSSSNGSHLHNGHNGRKFSSYLTPGQLNIDGGGSWSDLARQDATLPKDAASPALTEPGGKGEHSGGVFGFLKSKRGRTHSPRPKERGVLGKEGARVVVG